jgi:hypothetical protein
VQDAGAVGGGQGVHDLGADAGGLARVQRAALAQDVVQGRPVDQFHDDDRAAVDLGDVVHGDDAGMAYPGRRARLASHPHLEIRQFGTGRVGVGAQFLDRDLTAEDLVDGLPDDAHAAAPQRRRDAIAAGQQPSGPVRLPVLPR